MASHRRPKQPARARTSVLTVTAAAAVALTSQTAHADEPSIKDVKAEVDKLYEDAEVATEKYNGAKESYGKLRKQVDNLRDSSARGQADLNDLMNDLGGMGAAEYRNGAMDLTVQLLLSPDPDRYLGKASTVEQMNARQTSALKKIETKQRTLKQQRTEASSKLEDLSETRTELGKKKSTVQGKLREAQTLLNSLNAEQKKEMAAQETRATRASAERVDLGQEASTSGVAGAALAAAKSKMGSPYVWGATGPSSFDCSGLTSWAYNQAGVSLPRISQDQANAGTRLTRDQLAPGDLVIFYGDLHHVALYAGNGQILHAPRSGTVVRYESIDNMPFQFGVRVG